MIGLRMDVRLRLTLWFLLIFTVILGATSIGIYFSFRNDWNQTVFKDQQSGFLSVQALLMEEPQGIRARSAGHLEFPVLFYVQEGEKVKFHSSALCWSDLQHFINEPASFPKGGRWRSPNNFEYALRSYPTRVSNQSCTVTIAVDLEPMNLSLTNLSRALLSALGIGLVTAAFGGYWLVGRALSPLGKMAETAQRISVTTLSERLPVKNHTDELGSMATVFNRTLDRLEDSFGRLSSFTTDVSHELRTPLTAIRSVGEVALRVGSDTEGYRDTIGSILEEADRLSRLVDSMLLLARSDSGNPHLCPERISIDDFVRGSAELLQVLAEEKKQTLSLELESRTFCSIDTDTLRQAIINILDNAIRFTPAGKCIRVTTGKIPEGGVEINIIDTAPRIPETERGRIFDRFHRLAEGKSRSEGGLGLGLAIAKKAVEMNGGTVMFVEYDGEGNRCRIELPAL